MVSECLHWAEEHPEGEERFDVRAFERFRSLLRIGAGLTDKQASWVRGVHESVFGEPTYDNLVSRGLVPRGREVATPEVLKNLPLKPPQVAAKRRA